MENGCSIMAMRELAMSNLINDEICSFLTFSLNNATTATLVSASISQAADPRPSVHQSEASKATIK